MILFHLTGAAALGMLLELECLDPHPNVVSIRMLRPLPRAVA